MAKVELRDWIEAPMEAGLYEIGRVRKALGKDHYVFRVLSQHR